MSSESTKDVTILLSFAILVIRNAISIHLIVSSGLRAMTYSDALSKLAVPMSVK
jgi:hypothetical protein